VQEFRDDDLESGRATTAERKHQDEEVEDGGVPPWRWWRRWSLDEKLDEKKQLVALTQAKTHFGAAKTGFIQRHVTGW